jgi:predicted HAD superfamily Cof-like phosphohydrolase
VEPNQKRVREFHLAFGQPAPEKFTPMRDPKLLELHARLLLEEALEFCSAIGVRIDPIDDDYICDIDDIVLEFDPAQTIDDCKMIDALCDIKYVADGAAVTMGVDLEDLDKAVHASNMSKLAADGTPLKRADGKVIKSLEYKPPDIAGLLVQVTS